MDMNEAEAEREKERKRTILLNLSQETEVFVNVMYALQNQLIIFHRKNHEFDFEIETKRKSVETFIAKIPGNRGNNADFFWRRYFRVSRWQFYQLLDILNDSANFKQDYERGKYCHRTGNNPVVNNDVCLGLTLAFLGGMPVSTLSAYFGVAYPLRIVWMVITCLEIELKDNRDYFPDPETSEGRKEYMRRAQEWVEKGRTPHANGTTLFFGCVGCVDGVLIPIKCPISRPRGFFTRKGYYAINAQVICDANGRIIFYDASSFGANHDSVAFAATLFERNILDNSPFYIAGDDAYGNSETIITPFVGRNISNEEDAYNFWLSNKRIEIECVFGRLVKRWAILKFVPQEPPQAMRIIELCFMLHNFSSCQPGDYFNTDEVDLENEIDTGDYVINEHQNGAALPESIRSRNRYRGNQSKRSRFVQELAQHNVTRPSRNTSS